MVKFVKVDPDEIKNIRESRRGRVSYPILKGFLETGQFLVMLDTTGMQQSKQSLSSSLNAYIRNHHMPIKLFQRGGNMYLMRLDIDEEGNEIEDWEIGSIQAQIDKEDIHPLTPELVDEKFRTEKDQTTK